MVKLTKLINFIHLLHFKYVWHIGMEIETLIHITTEKIAISGTSRRYNIANIYYCMNHLISKRLT